MPLDKRAGQAAISRNIKTELAAGRPRKQAIAIALRTAGRPKRASRISIPKIRGR